MTSQVQDIFGPFQSRKMGRKELLDLARSFGGPMASCTFPGAVRGNVQQSAPAPIAPHA